MSRVRTLIATAVAAGVFFPMIASALPLECKPAVTSPMVLTTDQVEPAWKTAVTTSLGADWADFGRARNKKYYDVNLALAVMHYVIAQPCRPWRPADAIINKGAMKATP